MHADATRHQIPLDVTAQTFVCFSVLQCAAVDNITELQCVRWHLFLLQCVAVFCSVLRCVAVWCGMLHCVAVCCNVLQYVAMRCSRLLRAAVCRCGGTNSQPNNFDKEHIAEPRHTETSKRHTDRDTQRQKTETRRNT